MSIQIHECPLSALVFYITTHVFTSLVHDLLTQLIWRKQRHSRENNACSRSCSTLLTFRESILTFRVWALYSPWPLATLRQNLGPSVFVSHSPTLQRCWSSADYARPDFIEITSYVWKTQLCTAPSAPLPLLAACRTLTLFDPMISCSPITLSTLPTNTWSSRQFTKRCRLAVSLVLRNAMFKEI